MSVRSLRSVLMLAMALLAIALAFRLAADGIVLIQDRMDAPSTEQRYMPTVVLPEVGDPLEATHPRTLRYEGI